MVSGDAIVVKQEAGNGNAWSYTATTDLIITSFSLIGSNLYLGTWISGTSGVRTFSGSAQSTKFVIKSGETLTANDVDVNTNGVYIGGFEL